MMQMKVLGQETWEGMTIAVAMSQPTRFTLFMGDQRREVNPTPDDDFHLMAVLSDEETGERIPYSTVWVTVLDVDGKVVFDERMWPMISRSMGTHYGVNVGLPQSGSYTVRLQVGPPQAARHPEYADRWLGPHRYEMNLQWDDGANE